MRKTYWVMLTFDRSNDRSRDRERHLPRESTIEPLSYGLNPTPGDQLVALRQWVDAIPNPMRWLGDLAGFVEHGLGWNVDGFVVRGKLLDDLAKFDAFAIPLIPRLGFSQSRDGKDERIQQNYFQFGVGLATRGEDVTIVGFPLLKVYLLICSASSSDVIDAN